MVSRREQSSDLTVLRFLREAIEELRKVSWPTGSELYRYTLIVIATVAVIASFIGAIDYGLSQFTRHVIYGVS